MAELTNRIDTGPSLAQAVMPLVRVMAEGDLSWAARLIVADAISSCYGCWRAMKEEQWMMERQAACAMESRVPDSAGAP